MPLFRKTKYPAYLKDDLPFGKQILIFGWEVFKVVVISLAIIIPVRYYLIKPFYVKGASMEPNFYDHEYLIINEISYRFENPARGDPVVFRYPLNPSQHFIKRVVGLPGETVSIRGGHVYIGNDAYQEEMMIEEPYLAPDTQTPGSFEVTLGPDEYFLLGDNRSKSLDSRAFGPVSRDLIVGKTLLRGWPLHRAGLLINELEYNL